MAIQLGKTGYLNANKLLYEQRMSSLQFGCSQHQMQNRIEKIQMPSREVYIMRPPEPSIKQESSKQQPPAQDSGKSGRSRSKSRIFKYKHTKGGGFGQFSTAANPINNAQGPSSLIDDELQAEKKISSSIAAYHSLIQQNAVHDWISSTNVRTPAVKFVYHNQPQAPTRNSSPSRTNVAMHMQTVWRPSTLKPLITFNSNTTIGNAPVVPPNQPVRSASPVTLPAFRDPQQGPALLDPSNTTVFPINAAIISVAKSTPPIQNQNQNPIHAGISIPPPKLSEVHQVSQQQPVASFQVIPSSNANPGRSGPVRPQAYSPEEYARIRAEYPALTPATEKLTMVQAKTKVKTSNNQDGSNQAFRNSFYSVVNMDQQTNNSVIKKHDLTGGIKQDRNSLQKESQLRSSRINVYSSPRKETNLKTEQNQNYGKFKQVQKPKEKDYAKARGTDIQMKEQPRVQQRQAREPKVFSRRPVQFSEINQQTLSFSEMRQTKAETQRYYDAEGEKRDVLQLKKVDSIDTMVHKIIRKEADAKSAKQKIAGVAEHQNNRTIKDSFNFTTRISKQEKQRDVMGFSVAPRVATVISESAAPPRSFSPPVLAKSAPRDDLHYLQEESYQLDRIEQPPQKIEAKPVAQSTAIEPIKASPQKQANYILYYMVSVAVLAVSFGLIAYKFDN